MPHAILRTVKFAAVEQFVDISCLYRIHTKTPVESECRIQLIFIISSGTSGFMMSDKPNTFPGRITAHFLYVEIRIRFGEREQMPVGTPVAVPSAVPAFDKHPGIAVGGSKINVTLGVFGSGSMVRSCLPGIIAAVHTPPYSYITSRFNPRHIVESTFVVKIQHHAGSDKIGRCRCHYDSPPRWFHRSRGENFLTAWPWCKIGFQTCPAAWMKIHRGIIGQSRFMDRQI